MQSSIFTLTLCKKDNLRDFRLVILMKKFTLKLRPWRTIMKILVEQPRMKLQPVQNMRPRNLTLRCSDMWFHQTTKGSRASQNYFSEEENNPMRRESRDLQEIKIELVTLITSLHPLISSDSPIPKSQHMNIRATPIFVSALLSPKEEEQYFKTLGEHKDVFAWTYKEMLGLDLKFSVHHLSIKYGTHPVKKSQRVLGPNLISRVETKINKLINTGFIREVKYPMWISSIVHVKKKEWLNSHLY
ncbi:hypothetical protein Sango_2082200 [Sesamum angolense]|uniref:Uncharacterized protein n=1 Tax=Sesamum angolense TaxID=2727404 RepID=A0AAE1WB73_9LAMI|nr:hypothetical protein Sango_2082200 [Sesamum angolense]